jgi:hypothetical protein
MICYRIVVGFNFCSERISGNAYAHAFWVLIDNRALG